MCPIMHCFIEKICMWWLFLLSLHFKLSVKVLPISFGIRKEYFFQKVFFHVEICCCWGVLVSLQYRAWYRWNEGLLVMTSLICLPCGIILFVISHSIICIWGLWHQKQVVSQAGISNCIPHHSVGCNYLSPPEIPAWSYSQCHYTMVYS